jgi:hypothetical protein
MAQTPRKEVVQTMFRNAVLDQLQQIHELNRAFLGLLQTRVRQQRACFGLPLAVRPVLLMAGAPLLDGVACFPRALFQVEIGRGSPSNRAALCADFDEAERELCLSILFAARSTSRHSPYQARLLFDLDAADVGRLAASSLADLQKLACEPGTLQCAFRERHWFWQGLFTTTRPELRRQLTLMALQPSAADWPPRRPPHASA